MNFEQVAGLMSDALHKREQIRRENGVIGESIQDGQLVLFHLLIRLYEAVHPLGGEHVKVAVRVVAVVVAQQERVSTARLAHVLVHNGVELALGLAHVCRVCGLDRSQIRVESVVLVDLLRQLFVYLGRERRKVVLVHLAYERLDQILHGVHEELVERDALTREQLRAARATHLLLGRVHLLVVVRKHFGLQEIEDVRVAELVKLRTLATRAGQIDPDDRGGIGVFHNMLDLLLLYGLDVLLLEGGVVHTCEHLEESTQVGVERVYGLHTCQLEEVDRQRVNVGLGVQFVELVEESRVEVSRALDVLSEVVGFESVWAEEIIVCLLLELSLR